MVSRILSILSSGIIWNPWRSFTNYSSLRIPSLSVSTYLKDTMNFDKNFSCSLSWKSRTVFKNKLNFNLLLPSDASYCIWFLVSFLEALLFLAEAVCWTLELTPNFSCPISVEPAGPLLPFSDITWRFILM